MYSIKNYALTIHSEEDLMAALEEKHEVLKDIHILYWPEKNIDNGYVEALINSKKEALNTSLTHPSTIIPVYKFGNITHYNPIIRQKSYYYRLEIPCHIILAGRSLYINTDNFRDASQIAPLLWGPVTYEYSEKNTNPPIPSNVKRFLVFPSPYDITKDIYNIFDTKTANIILKKIK